MKSKDTAMTADNTKPQTSRDDKDDMDERKNLAEIHKRIRLEKQNTGKILSISEAK